MQVPTQRSSPIALRLQASAVPYGRPRSRGLPHGTQSTQRVRWPRRAAMAGRPGGRDRGLCRHPARIAGVAAGPWPLGRSPPGPVGPADRPGLGGPRPVHPGRHHLVLPRAPPPPPARHLYELERIAALGWRNFERLVGEAYRRHGYSVEETGLGGADGGRVLVQCKQWRRRRVPVNVVREMYGLLAHHAWSASRRCEGIPEISPALTSLPG